MSLQVKILHHDGETVTIYAAVTKIDLLTKNYSSVDCDANYPTLVITDPSGVVKLSSTVMTKIVGSTGEYWCSYSLVSPSTGVWIAEVTAKVTIASIAQVEVGFCTFKVK